MSPLYLFTAWLKSIHVDYLSQMPPVFNANLCHAWHSPRTSPWFSISWWLTFCNMDHCFSLVLAWSCHDLTFFSIAITIGSWAKSKFLDALTHQGASLSNILFAWTILLGSNCFFKRLQKICKLLNCIQKKEHKSNKCHRLVCSMHPHTSNHSLWI